MKRLYFLIVLLSISYSSNFEPANGSLLNYTHIFFSWPQIPDADNYHLLISEDSIFSNPSIITTQTNSYLAEDIFNWGDDCYWMVCNENNEVCYDQNFFSVSYLPLYYPDNVEIITYDENISFNGINVLDFESLNFSLALDMQGEPIWYANRSNFNNDKIVITQVLPNGNFVGMSNGVGSEFNKDSEIVFTTPSNYGVHHQIYKTENDTYFFIDATVEFNTCPEECEGLIQWQGDQFIEVDNSGNVLWEWNMFDYVPLTEYNPYWIEVFTGNLPFDWSHSNSVHFDGNNVYVSIRNLSRITAIDYETKNIVWNLGNIDFMDNPTWVNDLGFSHQHSAQVLDNGNILFFDNGRDNDPQVSRCLEIDVYSSSDPEIVWEYTLPDSLLTLSRGECDRLSNGGTIITVGRTGHIIELDPDDNIVWKLHATTNDVDISIYRNERILNLYPESFSYEIDYLKGEFGDYFLPYYGKIDIEIGNYGWGNQNLLYDIVKGVDTLSSGMVNLNIPSIDFIVGAIDESLYTLNIYADEENIKSCSFTLIESLGNINHDDNIDILDIMLCVNFALGVITPNNFELYSSNLNGDSLIDILDILILVNLVMENNE